MSKPIVFLDTSIIIQSNLIKSNNINKLFELAKGKQISICIVDVVYEEVMAKIKNNVEEFSNEINKLNRKINSKYKLLKLIDEFESNDKILEKDEEILFNQIKSKFDANLKFASLSFKDNNSW